MIRYCCDKNLHIKFQKSQNTAIHSLYRSSRLFVIGTIVYLLQEMPKLDSKLQKCRSSPLGTYYIVHVIFLILEET